jgi:hypothetical protein
MDKHDPQTEAEIKVTMEEVKANFPWLSDATARTVAEDQVIGGVPSHESELVEQERLSKIDPDQK